MSIAPAMLPPRAQADFAAPPYDRWISPTGEIMAEFHRLPDGICIRFPGTADFTVEADGTQVSCQPVEGTSPDLLETIFANSVRPVLDNHNGGLSLHGSACSTSHGAAAFVGQSRRGKTTLAGACARQGHPFLTEDLIQLVPEGPDYLVMPQRPVLRLFGDSADYLSTAATPARLERGKATLEASADLPFAADPAPLRAVYVLGPGEAAAPTFVTIDPQHALAEVMQHAFVLDVEDKPRLRAHFGRLSDLALRVPFVMLDYPRNFESLPDVVTALVDDLGQRRT